MMFAHLALLSSPSGRGVGGEGCDQPNYLSPHATLQSTPHPNPLPEGEGAFSGARQ
jgi:hypothetical protein